MQQDYKGDDLMAGWNEWVPGANMTLTEVLDALKSASIGLDVKDKLYWSFFKVVQEAIKEGNANFDVEMAKGVYNTLKDRLDAGDTAVTTGLTGLNDSLKNFDVNWINKNLGKLDQTFMTEEFLQQIAGNAPVNAVPGDDSVTTLKMADGAATRDKLGDKFIGNGVIGSGVINIDTYLRHGATILSAPISGTLPSDFLRGDAGFLINIGSDPICFQMLFTYNKLYTEVWTRFVYTHGNLGTWERGFGALSVGSKSIKRPNLTDNFRDGGTFNGNIDTLIIEGSYLVLPPYTGTVPSEFTTETAFVIDVSVTGISWVTQKIRPLYGPIKQYVRTLRGTSPISMLTEWKEIAYNLKKTRKLLFLGDSISDSSDYPTLMGAQTGIEVTNGAIGGTTFSTHAQPSYDPFGGANLITAIVTGDWSTQDANAGTVSASKVNLLKQVDLSEYTDVTFAYGTNDAYSITQLGDEDDTALATWSGAINYTLSTLMTAYPHLQVSLISPIFRARNISGDGQNSDDFERTIGGWLKDFVEVEIRQGNKHHVPVLDLYNTSGINRFTSDYFLSDGLHLSDKGKERLANVVGAFLTNSY